MEAGVEHIGRGTASHVDVLIIVVDSNLKALEIAKRIKDLAKSAGMQHIYLVGNRVMNDNHKKAITVFAEKNNLEIFGFVPFDQGVIEKDMQGISPLSFKDLEAVKAIDNFSEMLIKKNI